MAAESVRRTALWVSKAKRRARAGKDPSACLALAPDGAVRWLAPECSRADDEPPCAAQPAPRGAGQKPPGTTPAVATGADSDDAGSEDHEPCHRDFSALVGVLVLGWRILLVDWAAHVAQAFIETRMGGHVAELRFCPKSRFVTIRVTLRDAAPSQSGLTLLSRIQAGSRVVRINPAGEAVFVEVACPFFKGAPAEATVASLVEELRSVLENVRLSEALKMK